MTRSRLFLTTIAALFAPVLFAHAAGIESAHLYAWSNEVGYINFASTTVSSSALGGYAWSADAGWINMSPALGGVSNDGAGHLSGSAWGENLGWIDFSGVSIDTTTGKFSGTATGSLVGTITFNCTYCDVQTDWRPAVATTPAPVNNGSIGIFVGAPIPSPVPQVAAVVIPVASPTYTSFKPPHRAPPSTSSAHGGALATTSTSFFSLFTTPISTTTAKLVRAVRSVASSTLARVEQGIVNFWVAVWHAVASWFGFK